MTSKKRGSHLPKHEINGVLVSGQEYQVFCLMGKGFSNGEIARQLSILPHSVGEVGRVLRKRLCLRHRIELVSCATREQIKREIKDGDFCRDDLLAEWLYQAGVSSQKDLLSLILDFRLLTPVEVWEQLRQRNPSIGNQNELAKSYQAHS
jgi:DNA-binding CsgD family transcriptional regulator